MKVRAVYRGWYGDVRRREGDEFELSDKAHFSHIWMTPIGWEPPAPTRPIPSGARPYPHVPTVSEGYVPATLSGVEMPEAAPTKRGPGRPPKSTEAA